MIRVLASGVLAVVLVCVLLRTTAGQTTPQLRLLNQAGEAVTRLTDGDHVRLVVEALDAVQETTTISFYLDGGEQPIGVCQVPTGQRACLTGPIGTLGWYWDDQGQIVPERTIYATAQRFVAGTKVGVRPRPVVMVHGFGSNYSAWSDYLGPAGYLARIGLPGYAVGDGQAAGAMRTGDLLRPKATTNTIAQNAAVLAEYIAQVKEETGAEQVDLVAHSMGGLIARYYIDRLMEQPDVAQLIMLGTPNGGSDCALLLGAINLYEPAALELRSDYVRSVFNAQITERSGVPFYMFAGTPVLPQLLSPCSLTPNDLVVSLESASAIPSVLAEVPILHIELNSSEELFDEYVAPLLRKTADAFAARAAETSPASASDTAPVQFSRVFTGMVQREAGSEHVIQIDSNVAVASFGLYDPSRSVTVTVHGASGNVIALDAAKNGLTVIDDPASLLYLGYGFQNPRPGPWRVTVQATTRTPPTGVEYAIVAHYVGGATIAAALSSHVPGVG